MIPILARRTFRMAGVVAMTTAVSYGIAMPLPYLAPLLAFMLTAAPSPPPGPKGLMVLVLALAAALSTGLVLIPVLLNYPVVGVLLIGVGLFFSTIISIGLGKGPVGVVLAVGLTMIPAAGMMDYGLAVGVLQALLLAVTIAVLCQWLVYPLFPEDSPALEVAAPEAPQTVHWLAMRAAIIVLPPVMLAFSNPGLYMPVILKSLLLAQQDNRLNASIAGRELVGSTVMAGVLAILFWFALQLSPTLWFFVLWMLLFCGFGAAKFYGVLTSRFTPSFWQNTVVTMFILLGPAVQDSASGNDVYQAFAVRLGLFIAVTLYAWLAITLLERLRAGTVSPVGNL
ncbi:MAG: DUF2955 domain-containing protein [Pseudomonadota bacterium]